MQRNTAFEVSKFLDNIIVDMTWTHALPFFLSLFGTYIFGNVGSKLALLSQCFSLQLLLHVRICASGCNASSVYSRTLSTLLPTRNDSTFFVWW